MTLVMATAAGLATPAVAGAVTPRVTAAGPVKLAAAEAETLRAAILKDRQETLVWLKTSPTSYLATVQRRDFDGRPSLTVGRAPDNDVRIDDPGIEPHHLRVTVMGDSFHVEALDEPARFKVKNEERRDARLAPSAIAVSRFTLRLSHQRFPAIIVFDPNSPHYAAYKGLHWFDPDLGYRYVLPLTADPTPDTVIITSTRGNLRRALRVGWFDFRAGGRPCRLEVTRLLEPGIGENDFGVFFRDATSGKQSYALGRYVDAERRPDGKFVLDFNNAYNPACAVSDHYNCPIPPRANRLTVAIRAGEMDSHYH
jgi:uncharacterized protein (DUF1684 family)